MATPFHLPVTAAQVGTYFVGQYYQVLQQQPEFVHQFYSEASTVLRIDGNTRETATTMLWSFGDGFRFCACKRFEWKEEICANLFLAPQQKGYFVLNDIFHFVDDDNVVQHSAAYLSPSNLDSKLNPSAAIREQVSNYVLGGDIRGREFVSAPKMEENGPIDNYNFPEDRLQKVPEDDNILEDNFAVQSNGALQSAMNPVQDHLSVPVEEPIGEPQKHTYASIVAKGQTAQAVHPQSSFSKTVPASTEWQHVPEPFSQPSIESSNAVERSGMEHVEEASAFEDEVEVKSVYVRNVPTTMAASEIEEEFKKFGRLKPDGVAIRTRKDIDICYAFVEFEDIAGVQNAIKASTVQIDGHQLYIEGRRPNRGIPIRGRGRGRGRISYQMDGTRGRFGGRGFARGNSQDGNDYNRPRANGFYRQGPRQERVFSSSQQGSRNGQYSSE